MNHWKLRAGVAGTTMMAAWLLLGSAPAGGTPPDQKPMTVEEIKEFLAEDGVHKAYVPEAPRGFSEDQVKKGIPEDNPLTRAKVFLGKQLYFDPRLSKDGTVSCASCHHPKFGFSDGQPTSKGIRGQRGGRNAPTVINRLFSHAQFWDGRAKSLEEQSLGPIANPIEMGNTVEEAVETVSSIKGYVIQFEAVFGTPEVTPERMAKAMAAYERTVVSGNSVYDVHELATAYANVDLEDEDLDEELVERVKSVLAEAKKRPMSESAQRGKALFFGKANCSLCHTGANFTDELYWNIGVGMDAEKPDLGRYAVTKEEKDKGAFKTPTLRNIVDTAPYMHDGKTKTLMEVMKFYNQGGEKNPWLSERIKPLNLTEQEMKDVVEFMKTLSGEVQNVDEPRLPAKD